MQIIKALFSYIDEETPLPAPADSCSKVTRRAQFRRIACPSAMNCHKLKCLIQHMLALFEENLTEVCSSSFVFSVCVCLLEWFWGFILRNYFRDTLQFRFSLCSTNIPSPALAFHLHSAAQVAPSISFQFHQMKAALSILALLQALFNIKFRWT